LLKEHAKVTQAEPVKIHEPGQRLLINDGPFAGTEAILKKYEGGSRAMALIELLSKPARLKLSIAILLQIR
jgi:transcriptional antiterminator RfaH